MYREKIAAAWQAIYAIKIIKEDDVPCQIEEGLFLGSFAAANNKRALKCLNVTHILTVANSLPPAHPDDFKYKLIEVPDRDDIHIAQYFNECFEFIEEAKGTGGGVLVHCFVGKSRSVSIVVAYLMRKHGMSMSQALELVKSKRPVAAPNSGFMLQLQNFEKLLRVGDAGLGLRCSGVLERCADWLSHPAFLESSTPLPLVEHLVGTQ